jgi:hypothetical protein
MGSTRGGPRGNASGETPSSPLHRKLRPPGRLPSTGVVAACRPSCFEELPLQEEVPIPISDQDPVPTQGSTHPRDIQPKCRLQREGGLEDWGGEPSSHLNGERRQACAPSLAARDRAVGIRSSVEGGRRPAAAVVRQRRSGLEQGRKRRGGCRSRLSAGDDGECASQSEPVFGRSSLKKNVLGRSHLEVGCGRLEAQNSH